MAESPKQGMPTTPLMQDFQEPNEMRTPSRSSMADFSLWYWTCVEGASQGLIERGLWPSERVKQPTTHTSPHKSMALPCLGVGTNSLLAAKCKCKRS